MSRHSGRRNVASGGRSGFTLLEVLIAVALSSVIMMALFGMFNAVVEVAAGVKDNEGTAFGERIFESILFDDLRSVYTAAGSDYRFKGNNGSFLGEDDQFMEFCTTATLGPVEAGANLSLQRVQYALVGGSDSKTLYRREKSWCGINGEWDWVEVPIVKGIEDIRIEYQDPEDESFVTEWDDPSDCPRAVLVEVEYVNRRKQTFLVNLSSMAREMQ